MGEDLGVTARAGPGGASSALPYFETASPVEFPSDTPPRLAVVIDTEEEFDWGKPLSRSNTATESIQNQVHAQEIFAKYGVVPTYVIDYPVATQEKAVRTLRDFQDAGRCEIGAHLHPWVNPPDEETVGPHNSYPGNLPRALEHEKLARLTEAIASNYGRRPTVYKAGRYGVGPATAEILEELGYEVDTSVVPYTEFTEDGGPDFRSFPCRPFWFGKQRRLLEVPLSVGFAGAMRSKGPRLYPGLAGALGQRLRVPGVLSRAGLLERIRLTPEGETLAAHRRITRALLEDGCRVFSLTYHSPSLCPGKTPYVRDEDDLRRFLHDIDAYLRFFLEDLGGKATTPAALYRELGGG